MKRLGAALLVLGLWVSVAQGQAPYPGGWPSLSQGVFAGQVIDGNGIPLRESEIAIRLPGKGFRIGDPDGFTVQALIASPVDGTKSLIPLNLLGAEIRRNTLKLFVDGPVSNGSIIGLAPDVLTWKGRPYQPGDITLNDARRFMSPKQAALWGKAYTPTDQNLFPIQTYPGASPAVGIPQPTDPAVVRAHLKQHFQRFVKAGKLKPWEMRRLLERFDNPLQRASFIDPVTGQFEPHLMAMMLTTAGTPGEGAIKALLDGENPIGKPAKVEYRELPNNRIAESLFVTDEQGVRQWVIAMNPLLEDEPFQAGSGADPAAITEALGYGFA
jgi:hypothetical protein